jgi:hypothetical protein
MAANEDASTEPLTLWSSPSELEEWREFAELCGETVEQTIRRVLRRAIDERRDFDRARREHF